MKLLFSIEISNKIWLYYKTVYQQFYCIITII
jgi:hypothetical protein